MNFEQMENVYGGGWMNFIDSACAGCAMGQVIVSVLYVTPAGPAVLVGNAACGLWTIGRLYS